MCLYMLLSSQLGFYISENVVPRVLLIHPASAQPGEDMALSPRPWKVGAEVTPGGRQPLLDVPWDPEPLKGPTETRLQSTDNRAGLQKELLRCIVSAL